MTKVSDEDLGRLTNEADDSRYCGIVLSAVAELLALRKVADAAKTFVGTPYWEYADELRAALRESGR